jgi:spermidine/putrescine transport system ATP-binding protein
VALARAVVNAPSVLLLDEPLGALDLKLRREMQIELKRIQQDVGITFLYVTHDQEEAMSMSDRIAVMRDGRVEQIGTPAEVYERPINAFVAGFVGISNMLEGIVKETGETCRVEIPGLGLISASSPQGVGPGESVLVAVRPEKIRMLRSEGTGVNSIRGRVADVSYLGAFTRYGVEAGEGTLAVVEQNEGMGPATRTGEEVWLSWSIEQTLVLSGSLEDHVTGQRAAALAE